MAIIVSGLQNANGSPVLELHVSWSVVQVSIGRVGDGVGETVGEALGDSVGDSVGDAVGDVLGDVLGE